MDAKKEKTLLVRLREFSKLLKDFGPYCPVISQIYSDHYGDTAFLSLARQQVSIARKKDRRENRQSMDAETREIFEIRDYRIKKTLRNLREMAIEIQPEEVIKIAVDMVESEGIENTVERANRTHEVMAEMAENTLFLKYVVANCL